MMNSSAPDEENWQPTARTVHPYFDRPDYIDALANSIEKAYAEAEVRPDILCAPIMGCQNAI